MTQTQLLPCERFPSMEEAVARAVALLGEGDVVALPTETVYGLAGDASLASAAAKIFEVKERPFFDPLICHLPSREWLDRWTRVPEQARGVVEQLAERFWPGPLTMVLPKREVVPDLVSSGLATVAVRMSAHPVFDAVVRGFGRPLAAPSANRFGRISPTQAGHVMEELGGRIRLILEGGATWHGVESTIVKWDAERGGLRILRSGPITREALEEVAPVCGEDLELGLGNQGEAGGGGERRAGGSESVEAPGQLGSHYAPRTRMYLEGGGPGRGAGGAMRRLEGRGAFLGWRERRLGFEAVEVLSSSGCLREAAATLFAKMRALDALGMDWILAERVPEEGLGRAINDRLRRASA